MRFPRFLALAAVVVVAAAVEVPAEEATPHSVVAFGDAPFYGSTGLVAMNQPIVGMAALPDGSGYWTVTKDGLVSPFGAAPALSRITADPDDGIIGMAATPSGEGYWLASSDGGVFAAGDAEFHGSLAGGNARVVAIAATPSGEGYWLTTRDGGVHTFGDAEFVGSLGGVKLNEFIVAMAPSPSGEGYLLVARDGGVFSFGDATFHGSLGDAKYQRAIVGIAAPDGVDGYLLAGSDGGVFSFGEATFEGSLGGTGIPEPTVAIVSAPGGGYWLALSGHLAPAGSTRAEPSYLEEGETVLGAGVRAGNYRQLDATPGCVWKILDDEGHVRKTGGGEGRHLVRLRPSDGSFKSLGCGLWSSDLFPVTKTLTSTVGDGTWSLGIDVAAGEWTAPGGPDCEWERLSNLAGLSNSVAQQGGGTGAQTVTLTGNEVAFRTVDCGDWSPD